MSEESEIVKQFRELLRPKSEQEVIDRMSFILQAYFLSEIERLHENKKIKWKELAIKIGTSPSYLTQVRRGDKKLNFDTLAKISLALDIRFEVTGKFSKNENFWEGLKRDKL